MDNPSPLMGEGEGEGDNDGKRSGEKNHLFWLSPGR
jgi:hypothetical protein